MTDNEIIKALECCPCQVDCVNCNVTGCDNSLNYIMENALALINRKKAEVEMLEDVNTQRKEDEGK